MSEREPPTGRERYRHLTEIGTRWADNDVYGHVNNVVYYAYFDTAVNAHLIRSGALEPTASAVVGLVVETGCRYFGPISFPDRVTAGLRVAHRGRTSVRYDIALFRNDEPTASAQGHFVHVYVERATNRPVAIPEAVHRALDLLA